MDLTPQVINEVEFSMARRGYDPDQVDEFLEKVAVAVGELQEHVAELRDRVGASERRAAEAERRAADRPERVVQASAPAPEMSAAAEAELETLKRTLVLAQRTADAAVREAEDDARRIVAEAEGAARSAHESTRRAVLEEIATLGSARDTLQSDVEVLEAHMGAQRGRLEAAVADLQRILDEPARLRAAPAPEPSVIAETALPDVDLAAPATFSAVIDEPDDDDAWARFGSEEGGEVDLGPRTEPVLRLDRMDEATDDPADDAYLTELRKAMLDDTGAPDAADLGIFDDAELGRNARSARFGRRR
jgi:DivIVA domain-containing protein